MTYTSNIDVWLGLLLVANCPNGQVMKVVNALSAKAHPYTRAGILNRIAKAKLKGKEIVIAAQGLDATDDEIRGFVRDGFDGFLQIVWGGQPEFFPIAVSELWDEEDFTYAHENENHIRLAVADILMRKLGVPQLTARVFLFSERGWSGGYEDVTVVDEQYRQPGPKKIPVIRQS
jgi:hypothetical protein